MPSGQAQAQDSRERLVRYALKAVLDARWHKTAGRVVYTPDGVARHNRLNTAVAARRGDQCARGHTLVEDQCVSDRWPFPQGYGRIA